MRKMTLEDKKAKVKDLMEKVMKLKDQTSKKGLFYWETIDDLQWEIDQEEMEADHD